MRKVAYVRHWQRGSFVSDNTVARFEIPPGHDAVTAEATYRPKAPAYMWGFFWRWECEAPDGALMQSAEIGNSPLYVYGVEHTLEMVLRGGPEYGRALLDNMKTNGWSRMVSCAQGMLPADAKVIIDPMERPE